MEALAQEAAANLSNVQFIAQMTEHAQNISQEEKMNIANLDIPNMEQSNVSESLPPPFQIATGINSNIQQRIQDIQRIQHFQFLKKLEMQQQLNNFGNSPSSFNKVEPTFNKINTINGNSSEEIRMLLNNFNKSINNSLDKISKIDILEIKTNLDNIFKIFSSYNDDINNWYDIKYQTDKEKLYQSILLTDTKFSSYEKSDFISIEFDE
jgi:hypothetical protein